MLEFVSKKYRDISENIVLQNEVIRFFNILESLKVIAINN